MQTGSPAINRQSHQLVRTVDDMHNWHKMAKERLETARKRKAEQEITDAAALRAIPKQSKGN